MGKILNYKFTSIVLGIMLLWLGISGIKLFNQHQEVGANIKDLQTKADSLEKDNNDLIRSQKYAKTSAYLERQARLKLNYKMPDEKVVFVYEKTASSQPESLEEKIGQMENYQKWFYYVLGN
jgi:cell division protein FtsB